MKLRYDGEPPTSVLATPTVAPTAAPASAPAAAPASEFKLPEGWDYRTALDPALKESPSAKKYGSLNDLVRGFDNAQQLIGKPSEHLVEVTDKMDAKAARAVYERMGLPKERADYKINASEAAGKVAPLNSPLMQKLTEAAYGEGIMPAQLQKLYDTMTTEMTASAALQMQAVAQSAAKEIEGIKAEWGEAFDGNVRAANFAIDKLDDSGKLREFLNQTGGGSNPTVLKALAQVGKLLSEDGSGGDKGFNSGPTPDSLKSQGMDLLQKALNEKDPMVRRKLNTEAQAIFARLAK